MLIQRMYKQTAVTQRQTLVGDSTIKKAYTNNLSSFACAVQPLTSESSSILPGGFGKNWIMFCAVSDFKEGDKVVVDGTKEYRVSGVETYDYGDNSHSEVTLTAFRE